MTNSLHKFWWLWLPVVLIMVQIGFEIFCDGPMKELLMKEGGLHETLQSLTMAIGFVLSLILIRRVEGIWLKLWFGIAALGTFYVAGEEVSWGQWIFHWQTPAEWEALNDQHETNLHNISGWFDQKPQALLQIGILVGGIIIPLMKKYTPPKLPRRFEPIYGDWHLLPTALIALGIKIFDTISDAFHVQFFWRTSEVLELYMFYFVVIYLLYMLKKFPVRKPQSALE